MRSRGRKFPLSLRAFFYSLGGALLLLSNLPPQTATALVDLGTPQSGYRAEWIDRGNIRVFEAHRGSSGVVFRDTDPDDPTHHFVNLGQKDENCRSSLSTPMDDGQKNYEGAPTTGILYSVVTTGADDNNAPRCEVRFDSDGAHQPGETTGTSHGPSNDPMVLGTNGHKPKDSLTKQIGGTINITKASNGTINFRRSDDTSIVSVDGDKTFKKGEGANTYLEPGTKACRDSIIVEGTKTVEGRVVETGTYRERSGSGDSCNIDKRLPVTIMPIDDPDLVDLGGGLDDSTETKATCEASGFSLSWIFCPIINGLAEAVEGIFDSLIKPLLKTNSIDVNDTGQGNEIYQVWSSFRMLANILLVLALLVIVLGQSIGGGLIDAYTAKKIMPRLFAAAILINISIYLVAFMVDLTNILGEGIGRLITAPFDTGDFLSIKPNFLTQFTGITGFVGGTVALFAFPAVFSFLWVFVLLPALVTMIGVFVTLILRQGLILFLIITSPIAFALYCLPNTEKYFKKWWDLLFKALLMYPIVVILFAVANILAVTIAANNDNYGEATLGQVAGLIIMFLPLFMIPFAFKMAGGAVASIYGAIDGVGKKGVTAIKGNPNDQNSLQSRTRRKMGSNIVDARAGLQNRTSTRGRLTSRIGSKIGGGAGIYARQAQNNKEAAQRLQETGDFGNDAYIKGTTIPLSALSTWGTAGNANNNRHRNQNGVEQWQAADGTWLNRQQITEGHRTYTTGSEKQNAFKYVLGKAEPQSEQHHERVYDDFRAYANESGVDPGNATGAWQGITIPFKGVRADLRRRGFSGTAGNLTDRGLDTHALNTEVANFGTYDWAKETEGTYTALEQSILAGVTPGPQPAGSPPPAERATKALEAYSNLDKFVGALPTGPAAVAAAHAAAAAGLGPAAGGGGPATIAGSASAAHKNEVAARAARDNLRAQLQAMGYPV